jgi:hypothetical protein
MQDEEGFHMTWLLFKTPFLRDYENCGHFAEPVVEEKEFMNITMGLEIGSVFLAMA